MFAEGEKISTERMYGLDNKKDSYFMLAVRGVHLNYSHLSDNTLHRSISFRDRKVNIIWNDSQY